MKGNFKQQVNVGNGSNLLLAAVHLTKQVGSKKISILRCPVEEREMTEEEAIEIRKMFDTPAEPQTKLIRFFSERTVQV